MIAHFSILSGYLLMVTLMVISPGPNGALVINTALRNGRAPALINVMGISTAFYFHAIFSYLGVSALIIQFPSILELIKAIGASYLLYLGIKNFMCLKKHNSIPSLCTEKQMSKSFYAQGFLVNLFNPKVCIFYLAIFPQFDMYKDVNALHLIMVLGLVSLHATIAAAWFSIMAWASGSTFITQRNTGLSQYINITFSIILIIFSLILFYLIFKSH